MNFAAFWSTLFKKQDPSAKEMPYSLVLLLREPHKFSEEELAAAGERGWGKTFAGEEDPMYFVVQSGDQTMLKAGTFLINLLQIGQPYGAGDPGLSRAFDEEEQKHACPKHTAWAALDLMNSPSTKEEAYAVLARFVIHLADSNCTAIFIPKSGRLVPNNGIAELVLRKMAAHVISAEKL